MSVSTPASVATANLRPSAVQEEYWTAHSAAREAEPPGNRGGRRGRRGPVTTGSINTWRTGGCAPTGWRRNVPGAGVSRHRWRRLRRITRTGSARCQFRVGEDCFLRVHGRAQVRLIGNGSPLKFNNRSAGPRY